MANTDDLINFDIIEAQKENIQALPSGRSARKLAEAFSPSPLHSLATPTPTGSKNVNDCIRAEYEAEVANASESDDPLDIYDRYVRWTFDAYPSAQATPQSQLDSLLERATKAFIGSSQYKNDPRYLKLWLLYIQFFADTPRETFIFLSRHNIGESLGLYYEEYAAWLEGAGRWAQAEEVYQRGIEHEARPQQRLMRKFKEFEERKMQRTEAPDEPSSPALPTVRPALAAKVDPFAAARAAAADPQAPRPNHGVGGPASKPGKAKMSIFSDTDAAPSAMSSHGATSKGWDSIDSLANRKKENVMEPKPWAGETLKAVGKKSSVPKMQIFKDTSKNKSQSQSRAQSQLQSQLAKSHITLVPSNVQVVVNPVNGKRERVYVNLEAIYPFPEIPGSELSFEEVWATNRGWLDHSWDEDLLHTGEEPEVEQLGHMVSDKLVVHTETVMLDENGAIKKKTAKTSKKKQMELNETQIIPVNLDSSPKGKMRKRHVAEPTMTLHTRAATDDIYEIFNQPVKQPGDDPRESGDDDDDYETDGDYDSGPDSETTTTRHIDVNDGDDDETSDVKSVSEWSEFSTQRHVPRATDEYDAMNEESERPEVYDPAEDIDHLDASDDTDNEQLDCAQQDMGGESERDEHDYEDVEPRTKTIYVPIPPEDYEPRTHPYRDATEVANNRLPFMTPITEVTEMSLGATTGRRRRYYAASQQASEDEEDEDEDEDEELLVLPSSPLKEIVNDARRAGIADSSSSGAIKSPALASNVSSRGPIITDAQCNPVDDFVKNEILAKMHPPLAVYKGFYDHRDEKYERGTELRKMLKAMSKAKLGVADRTSNAFPLVSIEFPDSSTKFTVRKELGAGAFAPVYLVENSNVEDDYPDSVDKENSNPTSSMGKAAVAIGRPRTPLEALKMEQPPSAWEFHMMRVIHTRLGPQNRATASLSYAQEMHLYQDEGFLFLPFHSHGSLLDVINMFRADSSGVMDEQLAMFFSIELLRTVEALHTHGLMHGDLKPDNCLLRLDGKPSTPLATQYRADGTNGWDARGVMLIDFGRAIDMRDFAETTQFVADWKTSAQDCAEMREGRPWTWQMDYHGLASIVHCLLFGRYIDTVRYDQDGIGSSGRRYRIRENLKRYWQVDIWGDCFEMLLNPGSYAMDHEGNGKMPLINSMKDVRQRMENWLEANCERGAGLRGLIGKVEAHAHTKTRK